MIKVKTAGNTLVDISEVHVKTTGNKLTKIAEGYQVVSVNGEKRLIPVFLSECKHAWEETEYSSATCNSTEYWKYTCTKCGEEKYEYGESSNEAYHEYVEDEGRIEPTCQGPGVTSFTCRHCGDWYESTLEALEHEYEVNRTEGGVTTYTCKNCGDEYSEEEVWCTCDNPTDGGTSGPYTICGNCGGITGV